MKPHCDTCTCKPPEPGQHSQKCVETHAKWREVWEATRGETVSELIAAAHEASRAADKCGACLAGGRP